MLLLRRLLDWLLHRVWQVHPPVVLLVNIAPEACLRVLQTAARPSTQRLQLRNLFLGGRRYSIEAEPDRFRMTSNSKIPWMQRRRTRVAALLTGTLAEAGHGITRLSLSARMTRLNVLDIFLVPLWIGLLVVFSPLAIQVKGAALATLLLLSWLSHWYSAVLQALDMVYFVQVVLEEHLVTDIPVLPATADEVVYAPGEFMREWERFYDAHKGERE